VTYTFSLTCKEIDIQVFLDAQGEWHASLPWRTRRATYKLFVIHKESDIQVFLDVYGEWHTLFFYVQGEWHTSFLDTQVEWHTNFRVRVRIPLRRGVLDITLFDTACQWLVAGRWSSPGTPVSSANKTDLHDIAEILLKVALNTINQPLLKNPRK